MTGSIILVLLLGANFVGAVRNTGPAGPIKFHEIKECDPPLNNIGFEASISSDSDKTSDTLSLSFDLPKNYFTIQFQVDVDLAKREDNEWQTNFLSLPHLRVIPFALLFFSKTLHNFRKAVQPAMNNPLRIAKGSYKLENFTSSWNELTLPNMLYGRFMAELKVRAGRDELVCMLIEMEAQDPDELQ